VPTVDVLYALVPDDELDELRGVLRRRLTEDELVVRRPPPGSYPRCDERLRDDLSAARRGGAVGAVVGIAAGLVTAWLVGGDLALFLLLAGGGAALAGLIGAVTATQLHEVLDDDPAATIAVDGGASVHLLEVHSERFGYWAHRILASHRRVCLLESPDAIGADGVDTRPARAG
jgi:hypothetical protein